MVSISCSNGDDFFESKFAAKSSAKQWSFNAADWPRRLEDPA